MSLTFQAVQAQPKSRRECQPHSIAREIPATSGRVGTRAGARVGEAERIGHFLTGSTSRPAIAGRHGRRPLLPLDHFSFDHCRGTTHDSPASDRPAILQGTCEVTKQW